MAALAGCGALVACAASSAPARSEQPALRAQSPLEAPGLGFAEQSFSPQPKLATDADRDELALQSACGESDAALEHLARELAAAGADARLTLDPSSLNDALRSAGAPYVWPRAWLFNGKEREVSTAEGRLRRWLASFSDGGTRRCGVALLRQPGAHISVAAVAVDALADLEPLPTRVRIGQWLELRAVVRVPIDGAKLVVMGPRGAPHPVPTSLRDGRVQARFNADQPGAWLVQLLGDVAGGPRPLLEALVFAGVEPQPHFTAQEAPGEEATDPEFDDRASLYALVSAARSSERLPALAREQGLEALAQAHANAMRSAKKTAHDVGNGDLNQRLASVGLEFEAGENVAHAKSARLAQRALWASPSHRATLLLPSFDAIGIGVAPDSDGTLWVCQVFGRLR